MSGRRRRKVGERDYVDPRPRSTPDRDIDHGDGHMTATNLPNEGDALDDDLPTGRKEFLGFFDKHAPVEEIVEQVLEALRSHLGDEAVEELRRRSDAEETRPGEEAE